MKKSKFLKKSLAMLLALMLVVAMIPLSASAASIDLTHIYVNEGPVKFGSEVGVKEATVNLSLTDALPAGYELRVKDQTDTVGEVALTTGGANFELAKYRNSDNKVEFTLYKQVGTSNEWSVDATYFITMKTVEKGTTANLDPDGFQFTGKGVYSATVDNINGIVKVVLARNTQDNSIADNQAALGATMVVSTLDNATINGTTDKVATVEADDTDDFTVTSEDGNTTRTFKVEATYLDALKSFTITGLNGEEYTGTPVDTNYDNVPDTIKVTLPLAAIQEQEWFDPQDDVALAVSYEAEGHNNNVEVGINGGAKTTVKSDGTQTVTFTGLLTNPSNIADQDYVLVTRLDTARGAKQYYKLIVQLEQSASTTVVGAIVNKTIAEVDNEARTIVANLPNKEIVDAAQYNVVLWLAKGATAKIDNTALTADGFGVTEEGVAYDIYKIDSQNLIKGKAVTVTAQNGTSVQYTLTVAPTTNVTDATITAFWLKDPVTRATYKAEVTGKEDDLVVTVPYMTTKITDWIVYVTPASYTYVTDSADNQVYSGSFTAQNIGFDDIYVPTTGDYKTTLTAVNKNDTTVKETYTIHVKLDTSNITTGHQLSEVWFTAQPNTNNTDKLIYRGIRNTTDSSCNLFDQEVEQETAGNRNVVTLNIKVPVSLTNANDLGFVYRNTVTDFSLLNDQGYAFVKDATGNGYTELRSITATGNSLTGTALTDGTTIIVLPEEVARYALTDAGNVYGNGVDGTIDWGTTLNNVNYKDTGKKIADMGTTYVVKMEAAAGQSGSVLKSMSVGNTALSIEDYVISGKLNFSQTVSADEAKTLAKAYYATFELSDYAKLTDDTVNYYSNGDIDGDGVVDGIDINGDLNRCDIPNGDYKDENNYKFLFVRNNDAKHSVTVYRIYADNAAGALPNGKVYVKAEDRLDNPTKTSISTYTFDLTWAAPNEEAEITSFSIGNFTGKIVNSTTEERTITVEVPYGTDVTGLVAKFTASAGADLEMGSPESGIAFESGVTSVNYTNPVKVYVTSEDGDTTHMYTITVKVGLSFSDVPENAWYHDNVMDAANNGYVSGMGDGTFNPTGATTRAQFAAMIANAMGYDDDPDVASAFPDVSDNYWGKAAINFCYENEIITGYDDGTFQPEKVITRQEAAAILNNAFELAEKYGISTEMFPDNSAIADWAADHVYAAKAAGLMKGDADTGNFRPTSTITRAEAASIMMNAKNAGLIK